jgi:hypothetical protein
MICIDIETAQNINRAHRWMERSIPMARPESEALQEVTRNQYQEAVDKLHAAMEGLIALQGRIVELAWENGPNATLDTELDLLGINPAK